jgi:N utilization substance protein A
MLVALGKAAEPLKTIEDFAGAIPDELIGYTERTEGGSTFHPGVFDGFGLTRADAEAMIMDARVRAGWITEEDLVEPAAEDAGVEEMATSGAPA